MTTPQIVIKDTLTNEYYCVPMTSTDYYGNPMPGDNDFPYWSKYVNEAHNFTHPFLAESEMASNDLTESDTRNPIIEGVTRRYNILFIVGIQQISKSVKADSIEGAETQAKDSLLWPIEFHHDYPAMEVWISTEDDSDNILSHLNYTELCK